MQKFGSCSECDGVLRCEVERYACPKRKAGSHPLTTSGQMTDAGPGGI